MFYIFFFVSMSTEKTLTYHDSLADLESLKAVALPDEDDDLIILDDNTDTWRHHDRAKLLNSLDKMTILWSSTLDKRRLKDTFTPEWIDYINTIVLSNSQVFAGKQRKILQLRCLIAMVDDTVVVPTQSELNGVVEDLLTDDCIRVLKKSYNMRDASIDGQKVVDIDILSLIADARKWLHQKYPSLFTTEQENVEADIHFEPITREQRMDFSPPKPPLLQRIFPPRTNKKDAKEEAVNDMTVGASIEEKYIDEAADGKPYFPQISIEGDSLLLSDWDEDWKSYPEGRVFAEWEKKKGRWTYTTYNGVIQRGERRNNRLMEWEIVVTNWNANDITIRGSFADDGYLKQGKVRVEWFDEEKNLSLEVHIDSKQWKIYSFLEKKHWIGKEYAHYREGGDIVYFDTYEENTLSTQEMDTYFNKIETIMRDLSPFVK